MSLASGWEEGVEGQAEGAVKHGRDYAGQERARELEAGVCIALYQVDLKGLIYHKVVAEDLKGMLKPLGVYLHEGRFEGICHNFLKEIWFIELALLLFEETGLA